MAFAEKHGNWYRLVFRHGGKRFTHKLKTQNKGTAEAIAGGANRTLMLLAQQILQIPDGADVLTFVLNGGQPAKAAPTPAPAPAAATTLEQLKKSTSTPCRSGLSRKTPSPPWGCTCGTFAAPSGSLFICEGSESRCDESEGLYYSIAGDAVTWWCPRHWYETCLGPNAPYRLLDMSAVQYAKEHAQQRERFLKDWALVEERITSSASILGHSGLQKQAGQLWEAYGAIRGSIQRM